MRKLRLIYLMIFLFGCIRVPKPSVQEEVYLERKLVKLLSEATVLMRNEDTISLDKAHAIISLSHELAPKDERVIDAFGCVEFRRGDYNQAEKFFKQAIVINRLYDRPYAHLALVADRRGDKKAAFSLLLAATRLNPLNYRARNNLGLLMADTAQSTAYSREAYQELVKAYFGGSKQVRAKIRRNMHELVPE